jgi:hypothetical protein
MLGRCPDDLILFADDHERAIRFAREAAAVSHHSAHLSPSGRLRASWRSAARESSYTARLSSPSDTKSLIETAVKRFIEEVPALQPLKLVAGLELRGRGDIQLYRVELPGPKVSKSVPSDAKVTLAIPRSAFNELATKGHISDWRQAFEHGDAKATGIDQVMRLIVNVVEKQEERTRTRKARH